MKTSFRLKPVLTSQFWVHLVIMLLQLKFLNGSSLMFSENLLKVKDASAFSTGGPTAVGNTRWGPYSHLDQVILLTLFHNKFIFMKATQGG